MSKTKTVAAPMTIQTIIEMVEQYKPWFRRQAMKHGWLNPSWTFDDLQQGFLAHCLEYDLPGRYSPEAGANPKTYIYGAMCMYVNNKFRERFSTAKRRPRGGIHSMSVEVDGEESATEIPCPETDHIRVIGAVECLQQLRAGLIKRGDVAKVEFLDEVMASDCNLNRVAATRGTTAKMIYQKLRRLAGTPIGRVIGKEFLGVD